MPPTRLMFGLCLGLLLLIPTWTLLLWWLLERMVIAIGLAALVVALLILRSFPRVHVPLAGSGRSTSCTHCGYNLHANLSGVCPECGTRVAIAARAASTPDSIPRDGDPSN